MSLRALEWAFSQEVIFQTSRRFTLVALANFASDTGKAYPQVATVCRLTGMKDDTVREALRDLVEQGVIADTGKRTGPTGQVKVYQLPECACYHEPEEKTPENGGLPNVKDLAKTPENGGLPNVKDLAKTPEKGGLSNGKDPAKTGVRLGKDRGKTPEKGGLSNGKDPAKTGVRLGKDRGKPPEKGGQPLTGNLNENKEDGADAPATPKPIPGTPSLFTTFTAGWCAAWLESHGQPYLGFKTGGAKEGTAAKRLLSTGLSPAELLAVAREAWRHPDWFNCAHAATIAGLASRFEPIRQELQHPSTNGKNKHNSTAPREVAMVW